MSNLKPLLSNQAAWHSLEQHLDEKIKDMHTQLVNQEKPELIYRLQGGIKTLQSIKALNAKVE